VAQKVFQQSINASPSTVSPQSASSDSSKSTDEKGSLVTSAPRVKSLSPDSCWIITSQEYVDDTMLLQLPMHTLEESERFQATCHFFSSYSRLYSSLMQNCDPYGDLPPSAPLGAKAMMNAMVSAGMASLSNLRGSLSMRIAACREYSRALKWTNAAISDPKQATEDTTLAAILCLSLFEVCTSPMPST